MKVFIDCGAFKGRTLVKYPYPEYKRYAFECNPLLKDFQYPEDVTVIRKAVWTYNGMIPFYINRKDPETEGCSLFIDKTTGDLDTSCSVDCVDFLEWICENINPIIHNYVIMKMNIEGAEYDVLNNLSICGLIDELHVYWHYKKIPSITEETHNNLLKQLQYIFGDKLHSYY